jgi:ferrous iron transport protein B
LKSTQLEYSYLGYAGKCIEPAIQPLGYDWKIGIALISSFAAREVFVGAITSIYSIESEEQQVIVERLKNETSAAGKPVFTWATSLSILVFYVFAMQCMSTLAIVRKETNSWKYAIGQFVFMFGIAYLFSFLTYQVLA